MSKNTKIEKEMQEVNAMMDNAIKNYNKEAGTMDSNNNVTEMTNGATQNNNEEVVDMMNSTAQNNNEEATGMMTDRTETQVTTQETNQIPTVVTNNKDIMAYLVDEDERAIECGSANTIQNALRKIDQSPILGMGNIQNVLDNRLYALIYEDHKGFRFIDFCQKYNNGDGYSPKMRIAQDDLMTMAMYEMSSQPVAEPTTGVKRKISNFKAQVHKEYLGKFRGSFTEMIPVDRILQGLVMVLPSLPVYSDDVRSQDRMEFYNQVVELAKTRPSQTLCDFKSYYALTEEEVICIAEELKMKKLPFLRKLKEYGLLYLTGSSNGYQVNVRCRYQNGEPNTEWRYCILKLSHLTGEGDASDGIDLDSF